MCFCEMSRADKRDNKATGCHRDRIMLIRCVRPRSRVWENCNGGRDLWDV